MAKKEKYSSPIAEAKRKESLKKDIALAKSREKHLQQIDNYLTEELNRLAPETDYIIKHKSIPKSYSGTPLTGGFPVSPEHDPDHFAFYLASKETREKVEIMQIPPKVADKPAKYIKETGVYYRLQSVIPQAIEYLQKESPKKVWRKKTGGLEASLVILAGISILGAIFFLSSNITGNAIGNLSTNTTSFLSIGLLVISLIAGFFWLRNRKH